MDCLVVSVLCLMVSVEELGTLCVLVFRWTDQCKSEVPQQWEGQGAWADLGSVSDPCPVASVLLYLSCIESVSLSFGDSGSIFST